MDSFHAECTKKPSQSAGPRWADPDWPVVRSSELIAQREWAGVTGQGFPAACASPQNVPWAARQTRRQRWLLSSETCPWPLRARGSRIGSREGGLKRRASKLCCVAQPTKHRGEDPARGITAQRGGLEGTWELIYFVRSAPEHPRHPASLLTGFFTSFIIIIHTEIPPAPCVVCAVHRRVVSSFQIVRRRSSAVGRQATAACRVRPNARTQPPQWIRAIQRLVL